MGKLIIVLGALAAALAVTGLSFLAAPSLAYGQPAATVEELVVTAPQPKGAERKEVFAYKFSYADLDLKTTTGQSALRHRVRVTAEYVCHRLAATDNRPNTFGDCRRKAIDNAQAKTDKAIAAAQARTGPFHPGPAWQPPPGVKP